MAMATKNYPKAPITEAVIDFKFSALADQAKVARFANELGNRYPTKLVIQNFEVKIDSPAQKAGVSQSIQGFRLASLDQSDVCMAVPAGLTTSRLAPYMGWNHLRELAEKNLEVWHKEVSSLAPSRLGVRYINRIDVAIEPEGKFDPSEFLHIVISTPPIAEVPTDFATQIRFPSKKPNWSVLLQTSSLRPSPLVGHMSLLLDIDVYRESEIPSAPKRLWEVVDEAREVKNDLFETMITESSRKLFF